MPVKTLSPTMQMLAISFHGSMPVKTRSVPATHSPQPDRALLCNGPLPTEVSAADERAPQCPARLPTAAEEHLAASWPTALTKPLPATVVARMLLDSRYQPGCRPRPFNPLNGCFVFKEYGTRTRGRPSKVENRHLDERWHNSGGKAGARDIPVKGEAVWIRRRYGSICKRGSAIGSVAWRFHEYSLLRKVRIHTEPPADSNSCAPVALTSARTEAEELAVVMMAAMGEEPTAGPQSTSEPPPVAKPCEEWVEDRSRTVFHIMPRRVGRGRPRREEELDQAALWARLAPGLAWNLSASCAHNADEMAGCVAKSFPIAATSKAD